MNVGSSINFDGRAFVDQQEEELEQEEENRQQELRELLTNALPDDLLEDEDSDTLSENSSISSQEDEHRQLPWNVQDQHKTSTPQGRSPPPLETPATAAGRPPPSGHPRNNNHNGYRDVAPHQDQRMSTSPLSSPDGPYDQQFEDSGRREAEGSDYIEDHRPPAGPSGAPSPGYAPHIYYPNQGDHYDDPSSGQMGGRVGGDWGHEDTRRQSQQYDPPSDRKDSHGPTGIPNGPSFPTGPSIGQPLQVQVYPDHSAQHPPSQMIQYRGRNAASRMEPPQTAPGVDHGERYPALGRAASTEPTPPENLQDQYLHPGGGNQQVAQLQILYQARGREIEQLSSKLRVMQEEGAREKRILNHQLAIAEGEKNGLGTSYEQTKQLLSSFKEENVQLEGNLQAAAAQIQAINAAKDEILRKLQTSEATIETLTGELSELQQSQPLARARDHQDTVLAEMQRRHEEEMTDLQGRLQRVIAELEEKEVLADRYRGECEESQRALQQTQIQHAETMNRLTAQLEESQRRCQDLLGQGSIKEMSSLHQQLQLAENARQMSDSLCKTTQDEAADLQQQLLALEAAVKLGVVPTPEGHGDAVVRNLAKEDWSTPKPPGRSADDAQSIQEIKALRKEFERSLVNNRNKRNQVVQLQNELKAVKQELVGWKQRAEKTESQKKSPQSSPAVTTSPDEVKRLQAEVRRLTEELEAVRRSEGNLRGENQQIKQQMTEMVAENDEDKRKALERCQNTCMQLHEDRSQKLREELESAARTEKEALHETHQEEIKQLREQNEQTVEELDKVKQQYIDVCEDKNSIEDQIKQRIRGDYNKKLIEVKEKCDEDKEAALEGQKTALEEVYQRQLSTVKAEKDKEHKSTLKEQLEVAQAEWETTIGRRMVQEATERCEREWDQRMEQQLQKRLQEKGENVVCASVQTTDDRPTEGDQIEKCRQKIGQLEAELNQQAMELRAKEAQFESQLARLEQEHQQQMEEERRNAERQLEERASEAKRYRKEVQEQRDSKHAQNLKMLTQQWIEEKKRLEEKYRTEAASMREKYNAEVSHVKDGVDQAEVRWAREREALDTQLSAAKEEIGTLQSTIQTQNEEGPAQEVYELRGKLCRVEQEKKQMADSLNKELNYMKTRLKDANAMTTGSLESRLSDINRSKHSRGRVNGQLPGSIEECSSQTEVQPESHANCLAELQNQYLNTVTQIRTDVMQYIQEVREHCQQTVRVEVEKARSITTKKLRAHFTQCLKDQLDKESCGARNDNQRRSSTAMLGALNKFLENTASPESITVDRLGNDAIPSQETQRVPPDRLTPLRSGTGLSKDQQRGRTESIPSSEGCKSSDDADNHPPRGRGPPVDPGLRAEDGQVHMEDQELLQRTFDRLSFLDGSSDCEMRSSGESHSGEFMSLEELPLSHSDSSSELDQILQQMNPRQRRGLPGDRAQPGAAKHRDNVSKVQATATPSRSKVIREGSDSRKPPGAAPSPVQKSGHYQGTPGDTGTTGYDDRSSCNNGRTGTERRHGAGRKDTSGQEVWSGGRSSNERKSSDVRSSSEGMNDSKGRPGLEKRISSDRLSGPGQRPSSPSHITFRSRPARGVTSDSSRSHRKSDSSEGTNRSGGTRSEQKRKQRQEVQLKGPSHFMPVPQRTEASRLSPGVHTGVEDVRRPLPMSHKDGDADGTAAMVGKPDMGGSRSGPLSSRAVTFNGAPSNPAHTRVKDVRNLSSTQEGIGRDQSRLRMPRGATGVVVHQSAESAVRTRPVVDISGASVTTEYNDLPDKL